MSPLNYLIQINSDTQLQLGVADPSSSRSLGGMVAVGRFSQSTRREDPALSSPE
jgi:hypothetical protein